MGDGAGDDWRLQEVARLGLPGICKYALPPQLPSSRLTILCGRLPCPCRPVAPWRCMGAGQHAAAGPGRRSFAGGTWRKPLGHRFCGFGVIDCMFTEAGAGPHGSPPAFPRKHMPVAARFTGRSWDDSGRHSGTSCGSTGRRWLSRCPPLLVLPRPAVAAPMRAAQRRRSCTSSPTSTSRRTKRCLGCWACRCRSLSTRAPAAHGRRQAASCAAASESRPASRSMQLWKGLRREHRRRQQQQQQQQM